MTLTATPADARRVAVRSLDPADFPVPSGREEEWRFTPMDRLRDVHRAEPGAPLDGTYTVQVTAPGSVAVQTVDRADPRPGQVLRPPDRVAALAYAGAPQATVVTVPDGATLDEPVLVQVRAEGRCYGHLLIAVGRQARVLVVVDNGGGGTCLANVELAVGDGADVRLVTVDGFDPPALAMGDIAVRLGRDARLRHVAVAVGGELVRRTVTVSYAGPGGDAELLGLYAARAGQHLEHRLFVEHGEPHCRSAVTYKGALSGVDAHTVWVGDVLIRADAAGTDTYELNRNLLLSDGARADSVPDLEIETGEVVHAGHASATGRFDDEQLFYLMARGIPEAEARRLVVQGFLADVLAAIDYPPLRERLHAELTAELSA